MKPLMPLRDQTVVITGAAGNLGRAVAKAFADRHANLVLIDLKQEVLHERYGGESERRLLAAADLRARASAAAAVQAAIDRFGGIDILCNIAGGFRMGEAVHEASDETWTFLIDINVTSLLNMVRAVVPRMLERERGSIVNVGAYAALRGVAQMGAYCATKSMVIRLTEAMAAELRERNIHVNCVLPTTLDTPENRAAMPRTPPSQWVAPDALAETIVFLASPAARALHGAAIPVTGLG